MTVDRTDTLLWLDLETTGSDPQKDCILEVGAVLTTTDLHEIGSFASLVVPTAEGLGRLMLNPHVRAMHETNGLLTQVLLRAVDPTDFRPHRVALHIIDWLTENGAAKGRTVLAGSGVGHFDRRFLARWMPQVDQWLRYWCIDVGVIRRAHELWLGEPASDANTRKTHRALTDAHCHLEEARWFRDCWQFTMTRPQGGTP